MSYLVLARKYRSRDFESLVGQEHVVQALSNALTQQRLHHAYLFTGTRGVGKTSVSRILAKALNCTGADGQGGITAQPCGVCDACRDIDSGRFVDYVELDAASNRGVEEISQLLDQAVYKPVMGRFKVYMIDEVHMLSNTAFNAMLKTLEEPPEYLKFVLATTDPQKVPPTVLSRCLQFNLRPMAPQTVLEHLGAVLAAEGIPAEPGALRLLSRAARGSMRDALSLTDQAIAFGAGALTEAGVRQMLGAVDRSHAVRLVEALAAGQGADVVAATNDLRSLGLSASGTLEEMAELLQQMAVVQAVPDALDPAEPDTPTVLRLSALLPADEVQLLYSIVLHGRAELNLAPDEYSGLVMVLLRMLAFRPPGSATPAPAGGAGGNTATRHGSEAASSLAASVASGAPSPTAVGAGTAPVAAPPPAASAAPRAATPQSAPVVAQPATVPTTSPASSGPTISPSVAVASAGAPAQAPANAPEAAPAAPATERVAPPMSTVPPPAAPREPVRPAAVASAPVARVTPRLPEPPAWVDEQPFEGELSGGDAVSLDELDAASAPVEGAVAPTARRPLPADAPMATAAFTPTPLGDRWNDAVLKLNAASSITALAREMAMQAHCVDVASQDGVEVWRLRVEREMLRAPAQRDKVQQALAQLLGHPVRIEFEPGPATDTPAVRASAERLRRQAEAEQIIHNDPLVQTLMQQFKTARIVPGSVKFH
ncbi:DNA polymerase III subunit gamma/tau [Rhizobacter sp. LjRoot28]|uniref:DNA polymerase III subunit gamma/tau n=1 Tax=Rhizobacter sp. LjRoot28 TaxID=3342309 RepID=UPI003ED04025